MVAYNLVHLGLHLLDLLMRHLLQTERESLLRVAYIKGRTPNGILPFSKRSVCQNCGSVSPVAAQQVVDQDGNVSDVDHSVEVAVGSLQVDVGGIVRQQVVDQGRYIGDIDIAILVNVTSDALDSLDDEAHVCLVNDEGPSAGHGH